MVRIRILTIPGNAPGSSVAPSPALGISPGAVEGATAGGGVLEVTPVVGISPAKAEIERVHVKATVNMNRFIGVTPYLRKNHVKLFASIKIRPSRISSCKSGRRVLISLRNLPYFSFSESLDTHANLAEAGNCLLHCE